MAQEWLTKYLRIKPEVHEIFDELEGYLEFCKKQGYVFDEAHLGNEKTPWASGSVLRQASLHVTTGHHILSVSGSQKATTLIHSANLITNDNA